MGKNTFLSKIEAFSKAQQLLKPDATYLVALSGGADSVALLMCLKQLGFKIEAVHCNFHLRGSESDRDEQFCLALCKQEAVTLHRVHFDTRSYATLHKVSIEMAARNLRYTYFEQLRKDIGAEAICVAHHRDDCVETVLLNLVRGTGIYGLRGIMPKNGNIVRPLLCVSRSEIENYLQSIQQSFITDSSNLVADVQRNKVRLEVLPMLERINPAAKENIFKASLHMIEATRVFDAAMDKAEDIVFNKRTGSIDIGKLQEQASPEYTLYRIAHRYGFGPSQCQQILQALSGPSGKTWLSDSHELLIDRGHLLIQPVQKHEDKMMKVPEEGNYVFDEHRRFSFVTETIANDYKISRSKDCVCVDADRISFPLTIRHIVQGDRFTPFGMKGSRLVSDYLTDRKHSLFQKREQLVLTDKSENIVWLVNERIDNKFRITNSTKTALRISMHV